MLPIRTFGSSLVAIVVAVTACATSSGTSQIDAGRLSGEWVVSPDSLKLLVDAAAPHAAAEEHSIELRAGAQCAFKTFVSFLGLGASAASLGEYVAAVEACEWKVEPGAIRMAANRSFVGKVAFELRWKVPANPAGVSHSVYFTEALIEERNGDFRLCFWTGDASGGRSVDFVRRR